MAIPVQYVECHQAHSRSFSTPCYGEHSCCTSFPSEAIPFAVYVAVVAGVNFATSLAPSSKSQCTSGTREGTVFLLARHTDGSSMHEHDEDTYDEFTQWQPDDHVSSMEQHFQEKPVEELHCMLLRCSLRNRACIQTTVRFTRQYEYILK